ncbi:unnamed protein product [Rhizophagus irregularis]|nr:unnamed protein product [Rhizophagus irregularis]
MANEENDNNLPVNNPDTSRKSIDREQEVIIIKHDVEKKLFKLSCWRTPIVFTMIEQFKIGRDFTISQE